MPDFLSEPLVSTRRHPSGGPDLNWPPDPGIPVADRSRNLYCKWILCVLPMAAIGYVLGGVVFILLAILAVLLYMCCGPLLCFAQCWFRTWDWPGNLYLKLMYLVYQESLLHQTTVPGAGHDTMPPSGLRQLPKNGELKKWTVHRAFNIRVPKGSEEEFTGSHDEESPAEEFIESAMAKFLNFDKDMTEFGPGEDPVAFIMDRISSVYPVVYQVWQDKQSDEALTRFAMSGLGAHRIDIETLNGVKYFVVRTNQLSGLPVEDGYEHYGGDAYFTSDWRPAFIKDMGLASLRRDGPVEPVITEAGKPGWDRAKFRFRSSLSVLVTVVDHLYGIHLQASNFVVTANRECFSPNHPVRRFLTPFTYLAITVNDNAHHNLIAPGSFIDRCFALTDVGVQMAFAGAKDLIHKGVEGEEGPFMDKEAYYQYMMSKGIDTPYLKFGADYYRIIKDFILSYLNYYYASADEMAKDRDLVSFKRQVVHQSIASTLEGLQKEHPLTGVTDPEKFKQEVVIIMAAYIWEVTAGHEQVGTIGAYVQDASFCAFKWTPGSVCGTKQAAMAQALLMSFTSMPMPMLLGADWTHLFPSKEEWTASQDERLVEGASVRRVRQVWRGPREGSTPPTTPYVGAARAEIVSPLESFKKFQSDLHALSDTIKQYNADADKRQFPNRFPFYVTDPQYLETSVNV